MTDVLIRTEGRAGRITLNRPQALNALTWDMCRTMAAALDAWRDDPAVALVVIDGAGDRAFCAGGDIAEMYRRGRAGDFAFGRGFFADEYRLNARIAEFPKPYVALMHGFTMGGGIGVAGHGSHRIVGESARLAMPECAIGLIPDVGGTALLSRAPGRLGEFLGTTGHRLGPGDAILAGLADRFVPEASWPDLVARLAATGDPAAVDDAARPPPEPDLAALRPMADRHFGAPTLSGVVASLAADPAEDAQAALATLGRQSPLAAACTFAAIGRVRGHGVREALGLEYRFTARAAEQSDFLEGIRAAVIDKDRAPRWRHATISGVTHAEIEAMLAPLGADALTF
jgi:enoyl-CoA hydratase